jgi:XisI protein
VSTKGDYSMDTQTRYQSLIKNILLDHTQYKPAFGEIDRKVVFDDVQGNYILLDLGWEGEKQIHDCLIHVEMKGDTFWIHCDGTEDGVATELLDVGVPKENIVLAFHHPKERPYTGFAIA